MNEDPKMISLIFFRPFSGHRRCEIKDFVTTILKVLLQKAFGGERSKIVQNFVTLLINNDPAKITENH